MNETILNTRQEQILKILKEKGALSRLDLSKQLLLKEEISRVTLIRDLDGLIKANFVVVLGKGRAIRYSLVNTNPLLEYVDLDHYFKFTQKEDGKAINFNKDIYHNLTKLFSKEEIGLWEAGAEKYRMEKRKLDPSIYKRELERFVIELSWKSSQIEGNTYTLIEAETLIKQNIQARGHSEEEARMILNHKEAFGVILNKRESFKRLDSSDIVQLHNVLTRGLVTSGIRSQKVRITGAMYEPLHSKHEIEEALEELIKCVNTTEFPPEKALILAVMVAYVQPFADGNKRTARMLSNALLMAYDYPPLSYRNVDVNEYRSALVIFYETNSLFNFKRIFMEQLEYAVSNYFQ